ncbi:MAG: LysM peptidoglycan-binding domain-containing protein, partial [Patescibacteria group bacterium]|nr:LysM peptidoglycan-binding domain-containing protein [Patescibacteria group bacterium]
MLVRLYLFYLSAVKRLGLADKIKNKSAAFFVNQKLVHVAVAALTLFFIFFNLTQKTQAVAPEEIAGKTFLSEIISSEFGQNDQLIEEYFDEQAAITPIQQTYLDNLTAFKPQPMAEMTVPEDAALDTEDLTLGGDAIRKPDLAATSKVQRPRDGIIDYVVQAGDTVSTIAANFSISVNTILWENDLNAYSLIRPGNKLVILPMSGVAHKVARGDTLAGIASKYGVDANTIMETNKLASAEMISAGQKLIIPGGKKTYYASSQPSRSSAVSILKDLLKPKDSRPTASNKLAWPTVGARLTQYFSWRH